MYVVESEAKLIKTENLHKNEKYDNDTEDWELIDKDTDLFEHHEDTTLNDVAVLYADHANDIDQELEQKIKKKMSKTKKSKISAKFWKAVSVFPRNIKKHRRRKTVNNVKLENLENNSEIQENKPSEANIEDNRIVRADANSGMNFVEFKNVAENSEVGHCKGYLPQSEQLIWGGSGCSGPTISNEFDSILLGQFLLDGLVCGKSRISVYRQSK